MTEAKEKARDDEKMTPEMRKAWGEAYCEFEQRLPSQKLMPHKSGFIAGYSAAAGQWVKIEDGLPEKRGFYWVTRPDGTVHKQPFYVGAFEVDVVAWMRDERPEPFTE